MGTKRIYLIIGASLVAVAVGTARYFLVKGRGDRSQSVPTGLSNQSQSSQLNSQGKIIKTGSKYNSVSQKPSGWFLWVGEFKFSERLLLFGVKSIVNSKESKEPASNILI